MQIAEIYISHIIETGSGFAARTDDGEQVFIPASVAEADIYARPDQGRASFCMWAKDANHFLGEAGE